MWCVYIFYYTLPSCVLFVYSIIRPSLPPSLPPSPSPPSLYPPLSLPLSLPSSIRLSAFLRNGSLSPLFVPGVASSRVAELRRVKGKQRRDRNSSPKMTFLRLFDLFLFNFSFYEFKDYGFCFVFSIAINSCCFFSKELLIFWSYLVYVELLLNYKGSSWG